MAALPVHLSPHAGIEAELMLAGLKPLCSLAIWKKPNKSSVELKSDIDHIKLEEAVQKGQMMSSDTDIVHITPEGTLTEKFYFQKKSTDPSGTINFKFS